MKQEVKRFEMKSMWRVQVEYITVYCKVYFNPKGGPRPPTERDCKGTDKIRFILSYWGRLSVMERLELHMRPILPIRVAGALMRIIT